MHVRDSLFRLRFIASFVAAGCTLASAQQPAKSFKSTPAFVTASTTTSLGPESPSKMIDVGVWLNIRNAAGLDALYQDLYDPGSARYHSWLNRDEFRAQYAPTPEEAAKVAGFLTARGLTVVRTSPDNLFVHAQGSVAAVSKAFHVTLNRYQVNGKVVRANSSDPIVDDLDVAPLVRSISGLNDAGFVHPFETKPSFSKNSTKTSMATESTNSSTTDGLEAYCFPGVTTEKINAGSYPSAVFTGHKYAAGLTGCGYTPKQIQTAYNLTALYKKGFDGTGQTIVILDWCGSPTIQSDANAFSAQYGLPPLTSSNFKIVEYPTPSECSSESPEINLDVEWAHAVAPGANILLLVPPGNDFASIDEAEYYAVVNRLGNVISGSFGAGEVYVDASELANEDLINEIAGVFGISANFSTGDNGDGTFGLGFPQTIQAPASTPHATAIGGVSLALNQNLGIQWQTGWGTNIGLMANAGAVNPFAIGFQYGTTGGPSSYFAKPAFQSKIKGTMRQVPDISWLGDPMTGAVIAITLPDVYPSPVLEVAGGTSLACPMFSALWAIANQEAGAPIGQAAPYLYKMPSSTIEDTLPLSSSGDVVDTVSYSPGDVMVYQSRGLIRLFIEQPLTYTAIFDEPLEQDTTYAVSFGTDLSLTTTAGWDDMTGLGTPNPEAFADYFNPAKK